MPTLIVQHRHLRKPHADRVVGPADGQAVSKPRDLDVEVDRHAELGPGCERLLERNLQDRAVHRERRQASADLDPANGDRSGQATGRNRAGRILGVRQARPVAREDRIRAPVVVGVEVQIQPVDCPSGRIAERDGFRPSKGVPNGIERHRDLVGGPRRIHGRVRARCPPTEAERRTERQCAPPDHWPVDPSHACLRRWILALFPQEG